MQFDHAAVARQWRERYPARSGDGCAEVLATLATDTTLLDVQQAAYVLATLHHETAGTWLPIEEYGRGKGRPYGEPIWIDSRHTVAYYGRGYVQLTWLRNYAVLGHRLGIDLVSHPESALEASIAWRVLVVGMLEGLFTGAALSRYIPERGESADYLEARRVVNGLDCAEKIAGYARELEELLRAASGGPLVAELASPASPEKHNGCRVGIDQGGELA
ncbi:MAG: hypothetical protein A2Y78_04790 [Acidobacteria bacterium RBG_13_68_16]|nr:MAG: hypothetical protein A2Y78_04790 [Acidobacteria bacterium RBG_13_68_16]